MIDIFQGTGAPLSQDGFDAAVKKLVMPAGDGEGAVWSLLAVETRGFGYLPDKRPKILFERHIFHKRTGGRFSVANPDISNPKPGGYSGGAAEYQRLKRAMALDRVSALESASWGLGQVMGFNATALGYSSADAMVKAFLSGEDAQLDGCIRFIENNTALLKAVKNKNWDRVAFYYNGSNYAINKYDKNLRDNFEPDVAKQPKVEIRAAQACLLYRGFDPHGIDGKVGAATREAIKKFQKNYNAAIRGTFNPPRPALPENGDPDDKDTQAALKALVGV